MAVRPLIIAFGQSNSGPVASYATWIALHGPLSLAGSSRVTEGSYGELFTLPSPGGGLSWPAPWNAPVNLKGRAIRGFRYLTHYQPLTTGYATFPHVGRVIDATGGTANTSSAFYVSTVFDASAGAGPSQISITRVLTGETIAISSVSTASLVSGAGSRITLASAFTKAPTIPANNEEFTYQVKVTGTVGVGGTSLVLTNKFGVSFAGNLLGLKVTIGANTAAVTGWTDSTRTVTFSPALTAGVTAGDQLTLAPITGVPFHKFSLWLPWSPLIASHVIGKENCYPGGFDCPGHIHQPINYSPNVVANSADIDLGSISYHVGLAARLREFYGAEVYVLPCDFGGTNLAHSEAPFTTPSYGWHDYSQQSHWAPGKANNCFARLCDEIDAGIAAAALEGDTLSVKALLFVQGEGDAGGELTAERYEGNLLRLKTALRDFVKARGLWAGSAASIPWIQPKVFDGPNSNWPFATTVNQGIQRVASQDPAMRTFSMTDATLGDIAHYDGAGMTLLEERAYAAIVDVQRTSDASGTLDVCNLALSFLGDSAGVTSIDPPDGSAQATHCARFFPLALDEVLKVRKWTFATWRLDLSELEVDSPWPQWPYAYILPHDFLRVISILPPGVLDDNVLMADSTFTQPTAFAGAPAPVPHSVELDSAGRKVLYTVQANAVLRYTARTPLIQCPTDFRTLVAWKLAQLLAGPIVKGEAGAAVGDRCLRNYMLALPPQDDADADSRRNDPPHVPFTLQGRG